MENNKPNPVDFVPPASIAAIWSMMLPGLGQFLKGRVMAGIFWALACAGGYFFYFWPGLIIHLFCIVDAAVANEKNLFSKINSWPKRIGLILLIVALLAYTIIRNDLLI